MRQKNDAAFASMLDCVRRGCPTDETIATLEQRIIGVPEAEKFNELQQSGLAPVCLEQCAKHSIMKCCNS